MSHHYRSCSERQPQAQEFQSNAIIRVHPDSQQSLDRLFNPVQTAVPLRDRQLPKSFFNPGFKANESNDNNNNTTTNGNHHGPNQSVHFRSMSFDQRPNGRVHQSFHMRTASTLAPMPVLASSNQSSHQSSSNEFNSFTNNSTSQSANTGWSSSGNSMEDLMATKCEISNGGGGQSMRQQGSTAATSDRATNANQPGQHLQEQQAQHPNTHYHATIHHHQPMDQQQHQQPPPTIHQQPQVNHHHHHPHGNNHHYAPIIHHHHHQQQQPPHSPLQQQPAPTMQQQPQQTSVHHEHVPMHPIQPMQHQHQQVPQNHLARPATFYSNGANNHTVNNHHCTNNVTPVTNNNLHSRSMSFDQRQGPRTINQNFHMRTHSTVLAPMSGASSTNHSSHQSSHEFLNYTNQTIQSANEWSSSGYSTDDMTVASANGNTVTGVPTVAAPTSNWVPGQSQQVHAQPVQHHLMQPHHQPHQMMMQHQHHQPIQQPQQAPPQVFYT